MKPARGTRWRGPGWPVLIGAVAILAAPAACRRAREDRHPPPELAQVQGALLAEAAGCIRGQVGEAHAGFEQLRARTAELAADWSPSHRAAAQAAFDEAMDRWQRLEAMQVGPAASTSAPGGQGLRDEIYSWPLTGRCAIEKVLASQRYAAADFGASLVNVRGLGALEYLLFYDGVDNACSAQDAVNTSGSWAALSQAELSARKAAYAARLSALIVDTSQRLVAAWQPSAQSFADELAGAGEAGALFATQDEAVNALFAAITYVDKEMKDLKVGRPLGLVECPASSCPELVESLYARRSLEHLRDNLAGAGKLLLGCGDDLAGTGFDDLLRAAGAAELAERLTAAHAGALAAANGFPHGDLSRALSEDPGAVLALHAAIKRLTDLLKLELVVALDLELPAKVSGDND